MVSLSILNATPFIVVPGPDDVGPNDVPCATNRCASESKLGRMSSTNRSANGIASNNNHRPIVRSSLRRAISRPPAINQSIEQIPTTVQRVDAKRPTNASGVDGRTEATGATDDQTLARASFAPLGLTLPRSFSLKKSKPKLDSATVGRPLPNELFPPIFTFGAPPRLSRVLVLVSKRSTAVDARRRRRPTRTIGDITLATIATTTTTAARVLRASATTAARRTSLRFGTASAGRRTSLGTPTTTINRAMTTDEGATKRGKPMTIATHDGAFHCDEALGCYLLRRTREFAGASVDRSRDAERWAAADVVIDVGAVYDADKKLYDHHQREFTETFGRGFTTKLSSAGLVYKHYGLELVRDALRAASAGGEEPNEKTVEKIYLKMYEEFIEGVDGIDNGVNMYDTKEPAKYKENTGLSSRVKRLNPAWDEPSTPEKQMEQFMKAVEMTGREFDELLEYYACKWLPARTHVERALDKAKSVHESGEILLLETFCPWKEHLYEIEAERGLTTLPKFVLWQDPKGYRVSTIPLTASSFEFRKGLPTAWRGVRDSALSELSGIPGCVFIHAAGFIGGNDTYEGALAMAVAGLKMD